MSNRIRIKRRLKGSSETSLPELYTGELAYDETKGKLYIGESDQLEPTGVPVAIGGSGYIISTIKDIAALKDGVGATGTWNIDIGGNATTVTSGVYINRQITPGSGLFGSVFDLSADRTLNVGQGTGIIVNSDYVNIDPSYVITSTNNQTISGIKTFSSGLLVGTTGLGEFTTVGKDSNGIYVPSGTIRTQNLVVDGNLSVGTSIDISLAAEILAKGTLKYNANKFIFDSGIAIFTSGLYVGPTGSPTGVSLSGHKHVYTDITNFCTGVATCVNTPLLGGSGLVLNYSDPNLSIDIGQGYGILVNPDTISVDSTYVVMVTGDQNVSGTKTFNNGSVTDIKIQTNTGGTGTFNFIDGGSHISYIRWDGTNHNLIFDSNISTATTDFKKPIRYQVPTTGTAATSVPVFTGSTNPSSSVQTITARSLSDFKSDLDLNNVTNNAQIKKLDSSTQGYIPVWSGSSGDQLSYGYNVSIDLSTDNNTTYIPRADAVKTYIDNQVNNTNTIVRTTGNQNISGSKVFFNSAVFNSGLTSSGINSLQMSSSSSVATQFVIFTGDPSSSAKQLYTRTPSQVKSDIGLSNVTNNTQIKQTTDPTIIGYVPTWNSTSGESLGTGYIVETSLTGSSLALPRADAVKTYVDDIIGANNAMVFKGTIGSGGTLTSLPTTYSIGWTYRIITAGTYAGKVCEVGDLIIAIIDRSGSSNSDSDWTVAQNNLDGAIIGPSSATTNNFALFDGSTGKLIKDAGFGTGVYALSSRTITPGSGLFGSSALDLTADRTLNIGQGTGIFISDNSVSVDSTVIRSVGSQSISGDKTFLKVYITDNIESPYTTVNLQSYSTNLNNTTIFFDTDDDMLHVAYKEGGLSQFNVSGTNGINISSNNNISLNNSVVRTTGNQNIDGIKTFSGTIIAHTGSKVGIGTNNPNYLLDIYSDGIEPLNVLTDNGHLLKVGYEDGSSIIRINGPDYIYLTSDQVNISGNIRINGQSLINATLGSATNGQLLIGNGSSFSKSTLTAGTGISINNTSGGITIHSTISSPVSGIGTINYIPKWSSASGISNSLIYENNNKIGIGTDNPLSILHINENIATNNNNLFLIRTTGINLSSDIEHIKITKSGDINIARSDSDWSRNINIGTNNAGSSATTLTNIYGNFNVASADGASFGVDGNSIGMYGNENITMTAETDIFINASNNIYLGNTAGTVKINNISDTTIDCGTF